MDKIRHLSPPNSADAGQFRLDQPVPSVGFYPLATPVDVELIEEALLDGAVWLRHANPSQLADDPRFATALYRSAIDAGIMDNVVFQETAMAS